MAEARQQIAVAAPAGGDSAGDSVGADIRALRKARGMSLATLAGRVDRSIGWLSQVERGQTDASISDLRRIARHFGVPLSLFFRNETAPERERGRIVRKKSRAVLGSSADGLTEELLSSDLSGEFEMLRTVIAAGAVSDWREARPTLDAGYVVSGAFSLWIGEDRYELGAGDSFQFRDTAYRWANAGAEPVVIVWVVSPPVY